MLYHIQKGKAVTRLVISAGWRHRLSCTAGLKDKDHLSATEPAVAARGAAERGLARRALVSEPN